jgi:hypothetical protein
MVSGFSAVAMTIAAVWLWPLVQRTEVAYIDYIQRDVPFGSLLLQTAKPLFALCTLVAAGMAVLTWFFARRAPH